MSELIPTDAVKAIQDSVVTRLLELADGRQFSTREIYHVPSPPDILTLQVQTLTGFVDYVITNPDGVEIESSFIHVMSPTKVGLFLPATPATDMERPEPVEANCIHLIGDRFKFDCWRDTEQTIIDLQAKFAPTDDRDTILSILGNLKSEDVKSYNDDGVTQTVQTRAGVVKAENTDIPSRLKLRPYRTFPEIEQPEGEFIIRLRSERDGIQCALFEAGYSTWQAQAIADIAAYLRKQLESLGIKKVLA